MKRHNPHGERDGVSPKSGGLLSGNKRHNPHPDDASTKIKGGSVNASPTRDATAKTPRTLGPREA